MRLTAVNFHSFFFSCSGGRWWGDGIGMLSWGNAFWLTYSMSNGSTINGSVLCLLFNIVSVDYRFFHQMRINELSGTGHYSRWKAGGKGYPGIVNLHSLPGNIQLDSSGAKISRECKCRCYSKWLACSSHIKHWGHTNRNSPRFLSFFTFCQIQQIAPHNPTCPFCVLM